MSNLNKYQNQDNMLTKGNFALQLFTDRNEFTRLFAYYLNNDPPNTKILFFHGDGGNGKSLLLKFLQKKCCKRFLPEFWQNIKTISDDKEFAVSVENADSNDYKPVPACLIDFGAQPHGDDQPQDPFKGLLMLRRRLAKAAYELKYRLRFSMFDFASLWYLHKQGKSSEEIKRLFPSEEIEMIGVILDAFAESIWFNLARACFNTVAKSFGERLIHYWKSRGLDEEWVKNLTAMETDSDMIEMLPIWFAKDLNEAMQKEKAPPRVVLFFDTHEAFWGHERNRLSKYGFFYRDEWLRRLLSSLDLSAGIIVVAAGRERPKWAEAVNFLISEEYLNTQLVWHLSNDDAAIYMQHAGISDKNMQNALIGYASVVPNQVHPFYLGLCADLVLTAELHNNVILKPSDFINIPETKIKSEELIQRLLKYVDPEVQHAIEALSACRSFDFDLYMKMGKALNFNATESAFKMLIGFSFVWQDKEDKYHIHNLLQRLYNERKNPVTIRVHNGLEKYYRKQGNTAEAIYHRICRDRENGLHELVLTFNNAKKQRNFELCRRLMEIRETSCFYLDKWQKK